MQWLCFRSSHLPWITTVTRSLIHGQPRAHTPGHTYSFRAFWSRGRSTELCIWWGNINDDFRWLSWLYYNSLKLNVGILTECVDIPAFQFSQLVLARKYSFEAFLQTLNSATRSTIFLSYNVFFFLFFICIFRWALGDSTIVWCSVTAYVLPHQIRGIF